ncbi:MAG: hypothetical protein V4592_00070 [Bacteroidota bacterium]
MKKKLLMRFSLIATALWGTSMCAFAQYVPAKTTLGFNVGTQGVGIEGKTSITDQFGIRLGADIIPINKITSTQYLGSNQTTIDLSPRFSNVHLLADWRPFKYSANNPLSANFKLSGGAAYFIRSEGSATISLSDSYLYGDISIPKEDVGVVTAQAKWSHFAPYASLGLDNIPVFRNFLIGFEMGSYYISSPSASITGTNFLVDNDQNQPRLQSNLKSYKFMPVFQVNFNFNIK